VIRGVSLIFPTAYDEALLVDGTDVSAATHAGTFRNFMLCIENRLRAEGITDIIDRDDSMTQSQEEAQFNVFVVDAAGSLPDTPTPTQSASSTPSPTATPSSTSEGTTRETPTPIPEDINRDGRVDALDQLLPLQRWHNGVND